MSETDDFVGAHVAPDHAVRQPLLEWLIDDAAIVREIGSAAHHELGERQSFRFTAPPCFQHDGVTPSLGCRGKLDFPYALTAIAAVLLDDTRPV